ncbi:MAG TPA: ABC transporter permease [Candidatus Omnitrophota bacterium]|nr:ABC transporter permease [Candidatus Omnitrophota bacterium]
MNLIRLTYKNLIRKKIRTALTVGGVAIAVAVLVSLMGFDKGYRRGLQADIDKMGFQVLVTAKGCPYEAATLMLKGGGGLQYMEKAIYEKIVRDPRIEKITPQLVHTVFDPDKNNGQGGLALFMGIDRSFLELKPWMEFSSGGWFSAEAADQVIIGYEAAEFEQRAVGDQIYLPGAEKILTVAGILKRTGTQDDGILFLPLQTAMNIFNLPDKLTGIGIKLKNIDDLVAFEEDLYLEPGIQVVSMAQVRGTIYNLISSARVMTNSIALIAVVIALIGVINTILMSVFERTREIGVMRALGASRLDIFRIIWLETVMICFAGGLAGNAIAFLGGHFVEQMVRRVMPYTPSGILIYITAPLVLYSFLGVIGMGLVAGLYPAFRASSLRPIEAVRGSE